MSIKINSKFLRKFILIDNNSIQFSIQANKVIEQRERNFVCITFYQGKSLVGRFYNYSSLICLDEKSISTKIH